MSDGISPEAYKGADEILEIIYKENIKYAIKIISDIPIELSSFSEFYISCIAESDRAVPVLVLSFIDETLISLMSRNMNDQIPGGVKSLFDPMGPLGTSASRFKLAFALNWISEGTFRNLEAIRRIRNEFAHATKNIGFDQPRIGDKIRAMNEEQMDKDQSYPLRTIFSLRSAASTARMIQELLCIPVAQAMRVSPHDVMCRSFSELPPAVGEVKLRLLHIKLNMTGTFCGYDEVCAGKY